MVFTEVERLRASYRPEKIKILFVGESAPAGGVFFYKGTGQVHNEFQKILAPIIGRSPSFIKAFCDAGFYLDDLVLEPVNWLNASERKRLHNQNIASLAQRMSEYRPIAVVAFLKAIRLTVQEAAKRAGLTCPCHTVSFPGNGRQIEFRKELNAILASLL